MSAILDRWTNRLVNWALWEVSGSSRSVGIANYDGRWWDAPPRQTIALVGDAYDVDRLLHRLYRLDLTGKLQYEAVRIHYLWTGSEDMKAHQSGIPERTLRDRVFIAKYRLDDLEQRAKREITRCVSAEMGIYPARLAAVSAA